jgi:hypothetical protein
MSLGIQTRLQAGRPQNDGSNPGKDKRLPPLQNLRTGSGAHPPPFRGVSVVVSSAVKRLGFETDHSPP